MLSQSVMSSAAAFRLKMELPHQVVAEVARLALRRRRERHAGIETPLEFLQDFSRSRYREGLSRARL